MLTHLNIIYGRFHATTANLGNCHRDRQHVTQPGMFTIQALAEKSCFVLFATGKHRSSWSVQQGSGWFDLILSDHFFLTCTLTSLGWRTRCSQSGRGSSYDVGCGKWSGAGCWAVFKQGHIVIPLYVQPGWSSCTDHGSRRPQGLSRVQGTFLPSALLRHPNRHTVLSSVTLVSFKDGS